MFNGLRGLSDRKYIAGVVVAMAVSDRGERGGRVDEEMKVVPMFFFDMYSVIYRHTAHPLRFPHTLPALPHRRPAYRRRLLQSYLHDWILWKRTSDKKSRDHR